MGTFERMANENTNKRRGNETKRKSSQEMQTAWRERERERERERVSSIEISSEFRRCFPFSFFTSLYARLFHYRSPVRSEGIKVRDNEWGIADSASVNYVKLAPRARIDSRISNYPRKSLIEVISTGLGLRKNSLEKRYRGKLER